jgi:hypothetical protein
MWQKSKEERKKRKKGIIKTKKRSVDIKRRLCGGERARNSVNVCSKA